MKPIALESLFRSRLELAQQIIGIVDELEDYWPPTLRQVYYQCVAAQYVENSKHGYGQVKGVLLKLRENDWVPWHAIDDRTRRIIEARGVSGLPDFIEWQTKWF